MQPVSLHFIRDGKERDLRMPAAERLLVQTLDPMFRDLPAEELGKCGVAAITARERYSDRQMWSWSDVHGHHKDKDFDLVERDAVASRPDGVLRLRVNGQRHLYTFYFVQADPHDAVDTLHAGSVIVG